MLGNFFMLVLSSADFFKINFFQKKHFQKRYQSVKQFGSSLSVLIGSNLFAREVNRQQKLPLTWKKFSVKKFLKLTSQRFILVVSAL